MKTVLANSALYEVISEIDLVEKDNNFNVLLKKSQAECAFQNKDEDN